MCFHILWVCQWCHCSRVWEESGLFLKIRSASIVCLDVWLFCWCFRKPPRWHCSQLFFSQSLVSVFHNPSPALQYITSAQFCSFLFCSVHHFCSVLFISTLFLLSSVRSVQFCSATRLIHFLVTSHSLMHLFNNQVVDMNMKSAIWNL